MALTPEYLQGLPEELENLAMQFEADMIADISRRIAKAGQITDTAEHQLMILKMLGASSDYLEKLTAQYLNVSESAVKQAVFDAAQCDSEFYEAFYARANRPYIPFEYNDYLQQLADAAVNQTLGELKNFTRSMGFSVRGSDGRIYFRPVANTYRSAMDKAHMYAFMGGVDYLTAVRTATKEITAAGLQFVDYASGMRNHADVAVRRALLTGVSQMTGKIAERNARQLDTDVVEVSAHAGARPDHAEWQGRWYSLTGKDKRYPLLAEITGYGRVDGLKGANCRHDFYPVIPGLSEHTYTEEQLKHIDPPPVTIDGKTYTYYEAQQKQRAYERAIRKTKREIIAADASGDSDMFTAKSILLRRQKNAYGEFSKKAGLLPRIERTGVVEYGRSISTKSVWADRKAKTMLSVGKIDYMSNSFRPKYEATNSIELPFNNTTKTIPVKRVSNSKYILYTDTFASQKDKGVRIVERTMRSIEQNLPQGFSVPKIAVIDFEKNGINPNAIGGYDRTLDTFFFNSNYNTKDKIIEYVNRNEGFFANKTINAPFLHELGHKYYEDFVKTLAKSKNIEYNESKKIIDNTIYHYISDNGYASELDKHISKYAKIGYDKLNYTEIIAESFTVKDTNNIAGGLIDVLRSMIS